MVVDRRACRISVREMLMVVRSALSSVGGLQPLAYESSAGQGLGRDYISMERSVIVLTSDVRRSHHSLLDE